MTSAIIPYAFKAFCSGNFWLKFIQVLITHNQVC